jgi:phosphopantetheinyl transferase
MQLVALDAGYARVRLAAADASPDAAALLEPTLPPHEQERAARMSHPLARARFVVGRALCRRVAADALGVDPRDVPLQIDERGRPHLGPAAPGVSIAHTEAIAIVAIGAGVRVGVDVERADRDIDVARVLRLAFPAGEAAWIAALPAPDARRAALHGWVAREAVAKATGLGATAPFAAIELDWDGVPVAVRAGPGVPGPAPITFVSGLPEYVIGLCVLDAGDEPTH